MNGRDVAKLLSLSAVIVFISGMGMMLFPAEAGLARAVYCMTLSGILGGYLLWVRPEQIWVKQNLIIFSVGFALIALLLLLD